MDDEKHQHKESDQPRDETGSGHHADPASSIADECQNRESQPEQGDRERVANDFRLPRRKHPQGEDQPLEGELVPLERVQDEVRKAMLTYWSGPTPSPATLQAFNEVDPTFAERAFRMSEDSVATSNYERRVLADGDVAAVKRGQFISGGLAGIGICCAFACILLDHGALAPFFLAPALFQFFGILVRSVRQPDPDKSTEMEEQ